MSLALGEIEIRRMSAVDVARVLEIAASLKDAPHWPESAYRTPIEPGNLPLRVAMVAVERADETIAGFAIARVVAPEAELETIAVAADGQRRGVGRMLLEALVEELQCNRLSSMVLEVRESNRTAREFYRAQGFNENGKRLRYYTDPEEDAILMERSLG